MLKTLSWKTTLGGSVTALGLGLMGVDAMDWIKPEHKYAFRLAGFIMSVLGPFFMGLFSRDNDKTSEDVGAGPKRHP